MHCNSEERKNIFSKQYFNCLLLRVPFNIPIHFYIESLRPNSHMRRRASPDTEISVTGLEIFPYEVQHSSQVTGMKLEDELLRFYLE